MKRIHFGLAMAALWAAGCAPSVNNLGFDGNHPLYRKKIGIIYNRTATFGSEGVDDHDLREFLTAMGAGIGAHARNVTFVDLMDRPGPATFRKIVKKEYKFFSDSVTAVYAFPDSLSLHSLPDSLDCVVNISELYFSGGQPWTDTSKATGDGSIKIYHPDFGPGNLSPLHVSATEYTPGTRGSDEEWTTLRFAVWDIKKREAIQFSQARLHQSKGFGGETTTFAQDGEKMGQIILGMLMKPDKRGGAGQGALTPAGAASRTK